ncbi:hypothetical protein ACG9ZL_09555 [Acinetobacter sp. ULE_I057]|jgi:hypothetical protein|uniref:hypothetical protein n=1 Tax=Acinetobacter sp. ULE_I057 TaxID=3373070 RepID=UPI003AF4C889
MKVSDLIFLNIDYLEKKVEVEGWLTILNNNLFFLDEVLQINYKDTVKLKISNRDIIYILNEKVIFPIGGESFLFHRASIIGYLKKLENELVLNVEKILLEEDSPNEKNKKILIPIEINLESIEKAKKNNPNLLQENPSQDWLDWC